MTDSATSRAERAPLLASGDEGMRASSSGGGWGRFALDEPKKVLSASLFDDDEDIPALGSHSRRSASKEDDSDRDRQFLVPTTVMDALTEKMNAKTSRHTCVLPRVLRPSHTAGCPISGNR